MKNIVYTILLSLITVGCATQQVTPPSSGPYTWHYDAEAEYALKTYGRELLKTTPRDLHEWCPVPPSDRIKMWTALLTFISKRESGYDPSQEYRENFKNSYDEWTISTGLLQVSYSSCRSYGVTNATTESLKDPKQNLECGVRILNQWIVRHNLIALSLGEQSEDDNGHRGCAKYWSVCRPGESKEYIRTKMMEFCR